MIKLKGDVYFSIHTFGAPHRPYDLIFDTEYNCGDDDGTKTCFWNVCTEWHE